MLGKGVSKFTDFNWEGQIEDFIDAWFFWVLAMYLYIWFTEFNTCTQTRIDFHSFAVGYFLVYTIIRLHTSKEFVFSFYLLTYNILCVNL
jgi:hypothetical protein